MPEGVRSREMTQGPVSSVLSSFWNHMGSKGLMVAAGARGSSVQSAQAPPCLPVIDLRSHGQPGNGRGGSVRTRGSGPEGPGFSSGSLSVSAPHSCLVSYGLRAH